MVKALFFLQRGGADDYVEIKLSDEPDLVEFIYGLADQAGAPRPHASPHGPDSPSGLSGEPNPQKTL